MAGLWIYCKEAETAISAPINQATIANTHPVGHIEAVAAVVKKLLKRRYFNSHKPDNFGRIPLLYSRSYWI